MWPFLPYPYPIPPTDKKVEGQDPFKIFRKFQKFMEAEGKKSKDKEKKEDKKSEPWDQVVQASIILMISAVITGPVILAVYKMLSNN